MQTLNSPLELGLRTLIVLTVSFPRELSVDRLVLMDYCLLRSEDLGGPASVLPAVSTRGGELGIKHSVLEHGIQVMLRAGLIDVVVSTEGLNYRASEAAAPFLRLVHSPLLDRLTQVAEWAVSDFGDLPATDIRERIRLISNQWSEQWTEDSNEVGEDLGLDEEEASP
jgi:hypothetical protein